MITAAATMDWDVDEGTTAFVKLTSNSSFNEPTNWELGEVIILIVDADGFTLDLSSWSGIFWVDGVPDIGATTASIKMEFFKFNDGGIKIFATMSEMPTPNTVLSITDPTFPTMNESTAITPFSLSASNGTTPYTYSIQAGSLPTGLSLNPSTGEVSGTPTTASSGSVTFRVTDNASNTADTSSIAWTVSGAALSIANPTFPMMQSGTPITPFTLSASNGTTPYTFSTISGALPTGVSLNPSTGEVSGTPSFPGNGSVTFRVTDNVAATADTSLIGWSVSFGPPGP